jgi:hypothetical protein
MMNPDFDGSKPQRLRPALARVGRLIFSQLVTVGLYVECFSLLALLTANSAAKEQAAFQVLSCRVGSAGCHMFLCMVEAVLRLRFSKSEFERASELASRRVCKVPQYWNKKA